MPCVGVCTGTDLNAWPLCCICDFISVLIIRVSSMSNTIMLLDGACVRVCMFGHIVFRGSEKVFLGMSLIGFDQWAIHLSRNQERKRVFTHVGLSVCFGCFIS